MSASVTYLQNALVPQQRRIVEVAPCPIRDLAPIGWTHPFVAFVDGQPVLRADWELVIEDGHSLAFVDVHAIPQGGGGGSDPLRTVAMIAVIIYAPQLASAMMYGDTIMAAAALGATGFAMFSTAAIFVGMALVNAVLPAPKPPTPQQAAALATPSPTYSLQAQGNVARLDSAIPEHFGRLCCYPDFAAQPYTEFVGNEQYLYQLLCIGRGAYEIESIRIDKSPLSSYEHIDTPEVIQPYGTLTKFPSAVVTSSEACGQDMSDANLIGPFVANPTGTRANHLGVDYVMPRGLYYATDDGSLAGKSVVLVAEAQQIDDSGNALGDWLTLGTETITAATTTPQRHSFKYSVSIGRYQVRVHRTDTKDTSTRAGHDAAWAGLRAYLLDDRHFGDVTLLAMRMRASNNLSNQASRKINVICTRKIPVWNGSSWSGNTPTRSIAWAFAYACKSVGLSDAQMDLAGLGTLDAIWNARGDHFDGRFDNFLSFWEAVSKIAQAGRAKPFMQGGVMRLARDQAASIPVALFSTRNMVRDSFSVDYLMPTPDTADAVNVGYFDETAWVPATVLSKLSSSTADKPAKVDLFGVINRDHAHREGLYVAASNHYRRKLIKFSAEMEGFIPSFLDLVAIQHDMPGWGQSGEVTDWNSASRTLTLSEPLTWGSGTHNIILRRRDGSVNGPIVASQGSAPNQAILLTTPDFAPYTGMNEERTHYSFGWVDTYTQRARVLSVTPKDLAHVDIQCVNEDSNVHTADQGVITPVRQTSMLAGYSNIVSVNGLVVNATPTARYKMVVSWAPSPWATSYVVEQSTDGLNWVRVTETANTSVAVIAMAPTGNSVRVAAMALARGPWAQVTYTMPALEDVRDFRIVVAQNGVQALWSQPGDEGYLLTEIRKGASWDAGVLITAKSSTSHLLDWQPVGTLKLWARNQDIYGNQSAQAVMTSLDIAAPNPVQITRSDVQVNTVALGWTDCKTTQPIKSYAIHTGLAGDPLASCTLYGKAGADGRNDVVIFRSAGAKRLFMVAEDVGGNFSTPVSIDLTVTLPTNFVLSSEWDESWSGAKTNAYVDDGALYLPVDTTQTWDAHFASRSWAHSDAQVSAGFPLAFEPGQTSGSYVELHDIGKVIPSTKIAVAVQSTTLAGSVLPSVWIEWSADNAIWYGATVGATEAQATQARYVRVTYSVTSSGGDDLIKISRVHVSVSSEEKTEFAVLTLVAGDAAGTLYTCSKSFLDIVSAVATPNNAPNIHQLNVIVDDSTSVSRVYVQAWDSNHARTGGNVSLQIGGY